MNLMCVEDEVFIGICDCEGNGAVVNDVLDGIHL